MVKLGQTVGPLKTVELGNCLPALEWSVGRGNLKLLIRPALAVNSMVGRQEFTGCYIKTSPKVTISPAPVTKGIFAGIF